MCEEILNNKERLGEISAELDAWVKQELDRHGYVGGIEYVAKFYELLGLQDLVDRIRAGRCCYSGNFWKFGNSYVFEGPNGRRYI